METIRVRKDRLLTQLQVNRDQHRQQFEQAQEVFRRRVIEELDLRLEQARQGRQINLVIALPQPLDYTVDYDRAIQMIEWSLGDEVELGEDDFRQYVLNDWGWARTFAANTTSYLER